MSGAMKSITGALGGVIKSVVPAAIKAIAPAASKLLGGIAGDIFQKGAGFIKNALSALPLPGPLKAIGEKLLGTGLDKLTQFAQGGIDKLIQSLGDMVTKRFAPGAGNVALPGTNTAERQTAIANNNPAAPSSSSSAATGSSSSAATGSTGSSNPSGASSSSNLPPKPLTGEEAKDVGKQNEYNQKMFDYQQAMSNMNKFWEMMSTVQKSHDQTRGSMIQNLR